MAGHEIGAADEIGGTNRLRPEPQVRHRHAAGFLGIIDEIALRVIFGAFADDLDGILVRADGAVRTQAVEQGANYLGGFGGEFRVEFQARVRHIIVDADGEVIFGRGQ